MASTGRVSRNRTATSREWTTVKRVGSAPADGREKDGLEALLSQGLDSA